MARLSGRERERGQLSGREKEKGRLSGRERKSVSRVRAWREEDCLGGRVREVGLLFSLFFSKIVELWMLLVTLHNM